MLKYLRINNIILVEEATIAFNAGLNILTGETGSGKSAIMHGLSLALGNRADSTIIRKGCEKGSVEAVFATDGLDLTSTLNAAGIDSDDEDELIIRRELSANGKSRIFINNQVAQLAFLKKISPVLAQIIGQHANQSLYSIDYHRQLVDLFGNLSNHLKQYKEFFERENQLQEKLENLTNQEAQRLREIDNCLSELEELDEAELKPGEDEDLFTEYTFLVNSEELAGKINEINQALSGSSQPVVSILKRQKQNLDALIKFDPKLKETAENFQSALAEIQEISHTLNQYESSLSFDAERLYEINERLSLINRLKRKYGKTVEEILEYKKSVRKKLNALENADQEIEQLQNELAAVCDQTNLFAEQLTAKRIAAAEKFSKALTDQLNSLNMPKATFVIQIEAQKRNSYGDDRIEFFISPNVGENRIALKDGASGGEISRVLLALQTLLAGIDQVLLLIFDEVDANIGGETASIIGQKLREISKKHQVICITHFGQVASQADIHFQISKEEREGRTLTLIKELDSQSKELELARMSGRKLVAN